MNIQTIIATKRDGRKHSQEELKLLANLAATARAADYQLSAWLMAAYIRSLDEEETAWLTRAMAESGDRIDLTGLPKPWVDKHSTGGVGDKISIVLLPLLAACGLTVVKMSGRGLGITGGTVDKLGSVPGFRMDLSPAEMKEQAARIGVAITGQSPDLAPADKALYALRDTTATVGSIPLIVSSILSKKLAGGAETVVLDVKAGSGAFMKTFEAAQELAMALKGTGERCGLNIRLAITDMDQPLGRMVGNALEVAEAANVLSGQEHGRFNELCIALAGLTLAAAGKADSHQDGIEVARGALDSGKALAKAQEWFSAQGGDAKVLTDTSILPAAPVVRPLTAASGGYVQGIHAEAVGQAVVDMGGGRRRKDDQIDLSVGLEFHVEVGSSTEAGAQLVTIHAKSAQDADATEGVLRQAITIGAEPKAKVDPILQIL